MGLNLGPIREPSDAWDDIARAKRDIERARRELEQHRRDMEQYRASCLRANKDLFKDIKIPNDYQSMQQESFSVNGNIQSMSSVSVNGKTICSYKYKSSSKSFKDCLKELVVNIDKVCSHLFKKEIGK